MQNNLNNTCTSKLALGGKRDCQKLDQNFNMPKTKCS